MLTLDALRDHLHYNRHTGTMHVVGTDRQIVPDEDGMVSTTVAKQKLKMKYSNLVWYWQTGFRPTKDQVVHHKDLDSTNNALYNLTLITMEEHFAILEAMKNLSGALRIIPHPTDAFSYVLEHKHNGRLIKEVLSDITLARKKLLKLQLQNIKVVGKYTLTN